MTVRAADLVAMPFAADVAWRELRSAFHAWYICFSTNILHLDISFDMMTSYSVRTYNENEDDFLWNGELEVIPGQPPAVDDRCFDVSDFSENETSDDDVEPQRDARRIVSV